MSRNPTPVCYVCTHCQRIWLDDPVKQYCGCHPDGEIEEWCDCDIPWREMAMEARAKLDIAYEYARGANDYGGTGYEWDERVQLIHDICQAYYRNAADRVKNEKMAKAAQLAGTVVVIAGAVAAVGAVLLVITKLISLWT